MLFLLIATALQAQSDWAAVQALRAGDKVGVVYAQQRRVTDVVESTSADSLTVGGVVMKRDDVVRVYRVRGWSRAKRTLLGAGIGLAAGIALDQSAGVRFRNESSEGALSHRLS